VKHANPVSHAKAVAKVAVNAAVVALNAVMTHLLLTVANKPRLPITTQPTSEPNALSKQSQQTPHRKATSRQLARTTAKNAHRANAAAVTVMVASAVNVVTVPSHRQSKLLTPSPRPSRQRRWSVQRQPQLQLKL
jgi:hypothetical protein